MDEKEKILPTGNVYLRWGFLNLSPEQVQKIAKFESPRGLSVWEAFDYELFAFNDILNKEQLLLYIDDRERKLKSIEDDLVETDNSERTAREIAFAMEEIQYLESEFLPVIFKNFINSFSYWVPYKTKYDFVKAEYKCYLDEKKRAIIANHFRHNRGFQPNTLKEALLRLKKEAMYPYFSEFKVKIDEPTKAAIDMLKNHITPLRINKEIIMSKVEALYFFRKNASDKFREDVSFYAFTILEDKRSEEEKETDLYFSLLLIDEDYYGYK